jgi:uncharacterized protein with GYD domain
VAFAVDGGAPSVGVDRVPTNSGFLVTPGRSVPGRRFASDPITAPTAMTQDSPFTTYVALIDIADPNVQNIQEMASIWGDVQREFERIDASIEDAYAMLGEHDFLVVFEGADTETAFQADVVLERHGLDVQTMEAAETEAFADLVTDL